jgi:fucose permease
MKKTYSLLIAYAAFITLGIYDGLLGVAWPSIRKTFNLPLDALGIMLIFGTIGFTTTGFASGRLAARLTPGWFLLLGNLVRIIGLAGIALAPSWWIVVAAALFMGIGSGSLDAGLNTYIATHYSASRMNWLHACFGIGATLGPLIMTTLITNNASWRWGFLTAVIMQISILLLFATTLKMWKTESATDDLNENPGSSTSLGATLRLPVVWLSIMIFFLYTGTELSAGQWSFTLFTAARTVDIDVAGLWISIYWGSFTVGRILLGFIVDHVQPNLLTRMMLFGTILGAAFIWWNPENLVGFLGLAIMGFSLASIFPILITETPRRIGQIHAPNAIGFQVGAAGMGGALLPGLAGILARYFDLEIIGPFLVVITAGMLLLHEAIISRGGNRTS